MIDWLHSLTHFFFFLEILVQTVGLLPNFPTLDQAGCQPSGSHISVSIIYTVGVIVAIKWHSLYKVHDAGLLLMDMEHATIDALYW